MGRARNIIITNNLIINNNLLLIRRKYLYEYIQMRTAPASFYTNKFFGTVPRLPAPRLPLGGSLGTPKILGTGATLHLGQTRLHVDKWECCALKSSARCQKFGVPCRFFSACKCGFRFWWVIIITLNQLMLQSSFKETAQSLVNTLVLFSWHKRLQ